MNKGLILLLAVLIVCPVVFAETLVYDNDLFSWQTFTVDGRSFTVIVNQMESIVVKYNQTQYIGIKKGDNETFQNLRIWLYNISYDLTKKDYKAHIKVYSKAPSLEISRVINDSEFYIDEEAEISVNLTNTGTERIDNLTYLEDLTGFNITDIAGDCKVNGSYITYSGTIKTGNKISCTYKIRGLDEIEKTFKAKITYFDGFQIKEVYSTELNVKVLPYLKIESKYELVNFTTNNLVFNDGETETRVGEKLLLIIKLSNLKNGTMDVDYFDIYLPRGFEFIESSYISICNATSCKGTGSKTLTRTNDGAYRWKGTFGDYTILTIKLKSTLVGSSKPLFKVKYHLEDEEKINRSSEKYGASIESKFYDLAITSNIEETGYYDAGQTYKLRIYAANPSMLVNLKNVNINFYTNLTKMPGKYYAEMGNSTQKIIYLEEVKMPFVSSTTEYPLVIKADYETEFGDKFSVEYKRTIRVEPFKDLLITHDISKTEFEENEEIEITTKVENTRHIDIYGVNITDVIPPGFTVKGISSSALTLLPKETKIDVYTYKIKMPKIRKATEYNITTLANYVENNTFYSAEKRDLIKVVPKKLDIDISRVFPGTIYKGEIIEVDYTITNPETEEMRNIVLFFSEGNDFDTINNKTYNITRLAPGDKLVLKSIEKLRMKTNTSIDIKNAKAVYEDSDGNIFEKNVSDYSTTPKNGYFDGPALIITKTATNSTTEEPSNITITVLNIGTAETSVVLYDETIHKFTLGPNNYQLINYRKTFSNGTFTLDAAEAEYSYGSIKYYTLSNKPSIKITKPVISEKKQEEIVVEKKESQKGEVKKEVGGTETTVVVSPDVKRFVSFMTISTAILIIVFVFFIIRRRPKEKSFLKD